MDSNSLSHTKWNCKYHIVFAPKYRRKVAYGKIEARYCKYIKYAMQKKRCKNCRSRNMSRSRAYVGRNSTKHKCIVVLSDI